MDEVEGAGLGQAGFRRDGGVFDEVGVVDRGVDGDGLRAGLEAELVDEALAGIAGGLGFFADDFFAGAFFGAAGLAISDLLRTTAHMAHQPIGVILGNAKRIPRISALAAKGLKVFPTDCRTEIPGMRASRLPEDDGGWYDYVRSSSLTLVLQRVPASTCFTMMAAVHGVASVAAGHGLGRGGCRRRSPNRAGLRRRSSRRSRG